MPHTIHEPSSIRSFADGVTPSVGTRKRPAPPAEAVDAVDAVEPSARHRPRLGAAPQDRLLTPQAVKATAARIPGNLEGLLHLYALVHDEPHVTANDTSFHHWLSLNSLVVAGMDADATSVLAVMENTAECIVSSMANEIAPFAVRARQRDEVSRFPTSAMRVSRREVGSREISDMLAPYHVVKVCGDGHCGFYALLVAVLYHLRGPNPEALAQGLERLAAHAAPQPHSEEQASGRAALQELAEQVRAGAPLEALLQRLRSDGTRFTHMTGVMRSFMATQGVSEYVDYPGRFLAADHVQPLSQASFGLRATVVDSQVGLDHYHEIDGEQTLGNANALYLLRTGMHFDTLIPREDLQA